MVRADKAMEAGRIARELHQMCVGKASAVARNNACAELRSLYPSWRFLAVVGVGLHIYVPYDDFKRIPSALQHTAQRIEGMSMGRAYVFKDRRGDDHGQWIDKPSWDWDLPKIEVPTVWDRLGSDDDFG